MYELFTISSYMYQLATISAHMWHAGLPGTTF